MDTFMTLDSETYWKETELGKDSECWFREGSLRTLPLTVGSDYIAFSLAMEHRISITELNTFHHVDH